MISGPARRLAAARGTSVLGREAAAVAAAYAVYEQTSSAAWAAATLLVCEAVLVLTLPFAGLLADRLPRRRLLIASDLTGAAFAALLCLAPGPAALVALVGLATLVEGPFIAASRAAMPCLIPAADLPRANALLAQARTLGYALGPVVGGVSAATLGVEAAFLINAASFLVSAALIAGIRGSFGGGTAVTREAGDGGILAGAREIGANRPLRAMAAAWVLARLAFGLVMTALVVLAPGAAAYGALVAALGTGAIAGAWLGGRIEQRRALRGVTGGLALIALALAACALPLPLVALGAIFVLAGIGDGISAVCEETAMQALVPEDVLGRAAAAYENALCAASLSAYAVAGPLIGGAGAQRALLVAAGVTGLATAACAHGGREEPAVGAQGAAAQRA